tara:strand:+ start:2190 stop:2363 length:174 start_codon:yes stop_codon:yes gene_type:complete
MDIDTDKDHPKPIEQVVSIVKELSKDLSDIKADLLFIKSKIKEKQEVEKLSGGWWLF